MIRVGELFGVSGVELGCKIFVGVKLEGEGFIEGEDLSGKMSVMMRSRRVNASALID